MTNNEPTAASQLMVSDVYYRNSLDTDLNSSQNLAELLDSRLQCCNILERGTKSDFVSFSSELFHIILLYA
jgi:hypothetical protein